MSRRKSKNNDTSIKFHSMPVHAQDVLTDTSEWTDAEFGFYMRLLLTNWRNKGISANPYRLLNIPGGGASLMEGTTDGSTGGTTNSTTNSTTDGTYGGRYTGTNRLLMWEYIKAKFEPGPEGMLVNPRVEIERTKIIKYYEQQKINSEKGVEARKRKQAEIERKKGMTGGSTVGSTNGVTVEVPVVLPNQKPEVITSLGSSLGSKGSNNNNGTTSGTTTGTTTGDVLSNAQNGLKFYFEKPWSEFVTHPETITKGVTEESFKHWKKFVQWTVDHPDYHELFTIKSFLFPKDFAEVEKLGFVEDNWQRVIERYFSRGLQPKDSLYFKVKDAIEFLKIKPPVKFVVDDKKAFWDGVMKKQRITIEKFRTKDPKLFKYLDENLKPGVELDELMTSYAKKKTNG